ncbi:MAG: CsbD [Burkholderiales bacterium]|jgi:uncharacterized protein YjbJ (UPF0337 family)|nr:CsbD [Burkholderiales bacterium]MCE3268508.1 CsbD [Burkholderiales bacterium]
MNSSIFNGQWHEVKGKIKQKWADLTDDDLLKIEGNHEEIFGILEKRQGLAKEDAKKMIDEL